MKLKNIWLVLVSFIFLMAGNLLGLGDPSYVMLGLVPATFTDIKSLTEFTKTFNANSQGITDVAALTNGAAITKDPMSVFKKNTYHKDFKNFFKKNIRSQMIRKRFV